MPSPHLPALLLLATLAACSTTPSSAPAAGPPAPRMRWGLVIHGGAGRLSPESLTPERQKAARAVLTQALRAGHAVLARGGSSTEAVLAAVVVLEDSPLFNAGRGAVFTHDGRHELDAALMEGPGRRAGAVAGLQHVKNPILLAHAVMEESPHVMMVGEGAEDFARAQGLTLVEQSYFSTEERRRALERALEAEQKAREPRTGWWQQEDFKFGTVGAVALDQQGRLAAGTSTGGMTNKRWGRVGDVPVIGAGTYAEPGCAVSATGHGEYFIRYTVAKEVCARHALLKQELARAADGVVLQTLAEAGGEGGLIALDAEGHVAMPFNSPSMYRGLVGEDGVPRVAILKEGLEEGLR
jgi:beta-aspartyl-peptidase (threonine type)